MEPQAEASTPDAAELMAVLGLGAAMAGETDIARARLIECLRLLGRRDAERCAAIAIHASAVLAARIEQPTLSAELYGARARILLGVGPTPCDPESARITEEIDVLRSTLGEMHFQEAWVASGAIPNPLDFYIGALLHWLDAIGTPGPQGAVLQAGTLPEISVPLSTFANSTSVLIARAKGGDSLARERLAGRHLDAIRRYAHGRLPAWARDLMDTNDLAQISIIRGLNGIERVRVRRKGDFFAYLRQIVRNLVRDQIRRSTRRRKTEGLAAGEMPPVRSPLDHLLEAEAIHLYRSGLEKLPRIYQDALRLRLEQGVAYSKIAEEISCPTPNAARMVVARGLAQLAKVLRGKRISGER